MDFLTAVKQAVETGCGFKRPTGNCIIITDSKENPNKFFRLRKLKKIDCYVKENWHCSVSDILFTGWEISDIPESVTDKVPEKFR